MGRPREHDEATGEALLDAAEALLTAGGVDAVSVRAVADAAGTSTRAVYSRFGSKDGLTEALAQRGYLLLAGLVDAVEPTADPAADLVAAGIEGFRRFALERPQLFQITFARRPPGIGDGEATRAALLASYDALVAWIRRAQEAGALADHPPNAIAFVFHATCEGLANNELASQPPPAGAGMWPRRGHTHQLDLWYLGLGALVRGLAPEPPPSRARPRRGDV